MTLTLSEGLNEVYRLWDELREGRSAPSLDRMIPATLGKMSENMAVISVVGSGDAVDFKFVAVGSKLADRFAGAVYGKLVSELEDETLRTALQERYASVTRNKAPMFGKGDRELDRVPYSYEALTLPLIDENTDEVAYLISTVLYFTAAEYRDRFGVEEDHGPVKLTD